MHTAKKSSQFYFYNNRDQQLFSYFFFTSGKQRSIPRVSLLLHSLGKSYNDLACWCDSAYFCDTLLPYIRSVIWSWFFSSNIYAIIFLLSILEAALPPWADSNEEETIQQQILALSAVSISLPLRAEIFS